MTAYPAAGYWSDCGRGGVEIGIDTDVSTLVQSLEACLTEARVDTLAPA